MKDGDCSFSLWARVRVEFENESFEALEFPPLWLHSLHRHLPAWNSTWKREHSEAMVCIFVHGGLGSLWSRVGSRDGM